MLKLPSTATVSRVLVPAAAEISRESQDRIDHQFARVIVGSDSESRPVCAAQNEAAFHRLLPSRDLLIYPRSLEPHAAALPLDHQRPVFHLQLFCAVEFELGLRSDRTRARPESRIPAVPDFRRKTRLIPG